MNYDLIHQQIEHALTDTENPQLLFDHLQPLKPYDLSEIMRRMEHQTILSLIPQTPNIHRCRNARIFGTRKSI